MQACLDSVNHEFFICPDDCFHRPQHDYESDLYHDSITVIHLLLNDLRRKSGIGAMSRLKIVFFTPIILAAMPTQPSKFAAGCPEDHLLPVHPPEWPVSISVPGRKDLL